MQRERLSEGFLAAMLTPAALTYHLHQLRELQRLSSSNRSKTHLENILAFISSSSTGSFTSFFWACIMDQTLKEINAKYSTVCPYRLLRALPAAAHLSSQPCSNKTLSSAFPHTRLGCYSERSSEHTMRKSPRLVLHQLHEFLKLGSSLICCHVNEKRKLQVWGQRKGLLQGCIFTYGHWTFYCFSRSGTMPSRAGSGAVLNLLDKANYEHPFLLKALILSTSGALLSV